jgi:hypothetical protein
MRALALLPPSLGTLRVTGADLHPNPVLLRKSVVNYLQRPFEIAVNVSVERFQRRDVNGTDGVR